MDVGELMASCQKSARCITQQIGFKLEDIAFSHPR